MPVTVTRVVVGMSPEEYHELERKAKGQPLATYIKALIRADGFAPVPKPGKAK